MDVLNQTLNQLRDLFGAMTPGARLTAGLLLAVVIASLAMLVNQSSGGPDAYLFGQAFSNQEIVRMTGAMAQAGLNGYEIEGQFIKVPRGKKAEYVAAVVDAGEMPADAMHLMFDHLDKGSFLDSSSVKKQRMKAAHEQQLSLIISKMAWVDEAMVVLDEREGRGLRAERQASASVNILPAVGESLGSRRVSTIQKMVSGAHNIPVDQVTVTNLGNDTASGGMGDGVDPEEFDQPIYQTKIRLERHISSQIRKQLSYVPGVRIQVKADIDHTIEKRTVSVDPKPGQVLKQVKTKEDTSQVAQGPGGRPGLEAQGPGRTGTDPTLTQNNRNTTSRSDSIKDSVVGTNTVEEMLAGFSLKRADASVGIPESYITSVYEQKVLRETGEKPTTYDKAQIDLLRGSIRTQIESTVTPLLPNLGIGEQDYGQAKVVFFEDLPGPVITPPSVASNAMAWLGSYWNTIAMGGIALVSLVMLRSIVNGGTGGSGDDASPIGKLQLAAEGETLAAHRAKAASGGSSSEPSERKKLTLKQAETLKDDLADMVSGDPDAAAAILRSWINNAA